MSEGYEEFRKAVELLGIPVATGWDSIDAIEDANPLYVGRGGIMGDRAGNFAGQNADLVLAVGNIAADAGDLISAHSVIAHIFTSRVYCP